MNDGDADNRDASMKRLVVIRKGSFLTTPPFEDESSRFVGILLTSSGRDGLDSLDVPM